MQNENKQKNLNNDKELLDTVIKLNNEGLNISQIAKQTKTARSTVSSLMRMYNHLKNNSDLNIISQNNTTQEDENIDIAKIKNENLILKSQFENLQKKYEEVLEQKSQNNVVNSNLNILQDTFFDNIESNDTSSDENFEQKTKIVKELKEQIDTLKAEIKLKDQDIKSLKYQVSYLKSKVYDDFWLKIYNYRYFYLSMFIIIGIVLENKFSIFEIISHINYKELINTISNSKIINF